MISAPTSFSIFGRDGYSQVAPGVENAEAGNIEAPSAEEIAAVAAAAQAMSGSENPALTLIGKAGCIVKCMACINAPQKCIAICRSGQFKENIGDHYGTDDPQKVAKMIFQDLKDAVRSGTWSVGRLAFFGGAYGTITGQLIFISQSSRSTLTSAAAQGVLGFLSPTVLLKIFTPLGLINSVFILIFSFIIMVLESTGDTISESLRVGIITQCKALGTIWGRGYFYCYVGTTCILGPTNRECRRY